MWTRIAIPSATSAAPMTASLNFTVSDGALLRDPDRLHRRAEIVGRFLHELRELGWREIDDTEAARGHELLVLLGVVSLLDGVHDPSFDILWNALWRREAAPCRHRPVGPEGGLERRQIWIQGGRLRVHDGEAAHFAGVDQRARLRDG